MDSIAKFFSDVFGYKIGWTTTGQIILSAVIIICAFIFKRYIYRYIASVLKKLTARTKVEIDDLLVDAAERPLGFLILIIGFYMASAVLNLPQQPWDIRRFVHAFLESMIIIDISWFGFKISDILSQYLAKLMASREVPMASQLVPVMRKTIKAAIAILAAIWFIQNLGYSVSSLLAGLGLGGLAFALAAKDTISNVFGSFTIYVDRPFLVGDWIKADKYEGTVEEIGFRSTRIRSAERTVYALPNNVLANMTIENYSKREKRRVKTVLTMNYNTTAGQLEELVAELRGTLAAHTSVDQENTFVHFTEFASSSLNIEIIYYLNTTALREWLLLREEINLKLMRIISEKGLSLAFPSQSLYVEQMPRKMSS